MQWRSYKENGSVKISTSEDRESNTHKKKDVSNNLADTIYKNSRKTSAQTLS